jgi:hypothetical protein
MGGEIPCFVRGGSLFRSGTVSVSFGEASPIARSQFAHPRTLYESFHCAERDTHVRAWGASRVGIGKHCRLSQSAACSPPTPVGAYPLRLSPSAERLGWHEPCLGSVWLQHWGQIEEDSLDRLSTKATPVPTGAVFPLVSLLLRLHSSTRAWGRVTLEGKPYPWLGFSGIAPRGSPGYFHSSRARHGAIGDVRRLRGGVTAAL